MFDNVFEICKDLDVTILYYSTIQPFDCETLLSNFNSKIIICEPFFEGTIAQIVTECIKGKKASVSSIGIPREVIRNYGTKVEKDLYYGLSGEALRKRILGLLE